ncbi:amidase signature domain-containing protein [Aspergillus oleicola]
MTGSPEELDHDKPALLSHNMTAIYTSTAIDLPPGPYFLHGPNIHQAWRMYPDYLDAFIFGVLPENVNRPERFKPLSSVTDNSIWKEIAVPSRLYSRPSKDRPLAGARVSLKDIFHLAGTQTTMMSRAYTELYPADEKSASYVEKLIDQGAVIIGKTKMTQFASSDEPTDQWIDFHCPVNPRGDEYQSPSGSSSGAAAALAGYPWLDYSVAGDSAGSVRAPATCNGLFSIRFSTESTSMDGIIVNSPHFDVVGLFSRSLSDLHHITSHTMDLTDNSTTFPSRIIYPLDFFPHSNPKHQAMVEEFIGVLEDFLGTKRVEISLAERWEKCPPPEANGKSLKQYLPKSAFWSMCHDYYHGFDDFRAKYKSTYNKDPYEGPVVNFRWGIGKAVTPEEYKTYREELEIFRKWFEENVFSHDPNSISEAIMIMPYGAANPKYRDSANESPSTSHTIGEKFISPVLQMPQLVLPFGQMPYQSRVSGRLEHRPIGSTILGAKGSDLMLIKLARAAFQKASWPTTIATGRYMFPLAANTRNVAPADGASEGAEGFLHKQIPHNML